MKIAELEAKVEALNALFTPRRKQDPPHYSLVTSSRRAVLVHTLMVPTPRPVELTEPLQPAEMGAFLDAYTLGLKHGLARVEPGAYARAFD